MDADTEQLPRDPSPTDRVVNRHMARLLGQLEDANCPDIFVDAVKAKMAWMRADLNALWKAAGSPEIPPVAP